MPYTIRRGDTLQTIASRNGVSLAQLLQLNPELNKGRYAHGMIYAGGKINLPSDRATHVAGKPPVAPRPGGAPTPTPQQPASPPGTGDPLLDDLTGLPGQERDAYAALKTLFDSYGLGSLAPTILKYLQNGFGSDTITTLIQQTPEYKTRFAGNEARKANGLAVLTPAEYLSTEASYKQLLRTAGIDPSFSSSTQLNEWIGNDVSPTELQDRVNLAVQATTNAPPSLVAYFNQLGMTQGDMASYFLNDKKPTPQLQLKLNQAQIGAAGLVNNINVSAADAQRYAQMGVTQAQAQSAYQRIADILPRAQQLSSIYTKQAPVNQNTLQEEFLGQSGEAQLARERLSQQEVATFSGQAGTGKSSFQQQTAGAPGF